MAVDHYENFPVASLLLPANLRPAVKVIYHFARTADDIADEGDASPEVRLARLQAYDHELQRIAQGKPSGNALFTSLAQVIHDYQLPLQPFHDLLSAFMQDVTTTRYLTFDALKDYCRRSATPVGVLMLHLYGAATPRNLTWADDICSALQLINFLQDVSIDWQKKRIYLPQEDMQAHGVTEAHISQGAVDKHWHALMQYEVERTRHMMLRGAPLAGVLPGRIGLELKLVIQGGLQILRRIETNDHDVFRRRPTLNILDWSAMLLRACTSSIYREH